MLVVTGDHATPSILAAHGWQPVPVLVYGRYCGADGRARLRGAHLPHGDVWGAFPPIHLMPLVMANALRLTKFGA